MPGHAVCTPAGSSCLETKTDLAMRWLGARCPLQAYDGTAAHLVSRTQFGMDMPYITPTARLRARPPDSLPLVLGFFTFASRPPARPFFQLFSTFYSRYAHSVFRFATPWSLNLHLRLLLRLPSLQTLLHFPQLVAMRTSLCLKHLKSRPSTNSTSTRSSPAPLTAHQSSPPRGLVEVRRPGCQFADITLESF